MKKLIVLSAVLSLAFSISVMGSDIENRIAEIDEQITQLQSEKDYLLSLTEESEAPALTSYAPGQYKIGNRTRF